MFSGTQFTKIQSKLIDLKESRNKNYAIVKYRETYCGRLTTLAAVKSNKIYEGCPG